METCLDCGEDFPMGELTMGLCEDCKDHLDGFDLEDQLDKAMDINQKE
jgi:hypothetical protein